MNQNEVNTQTHRLTRTCASLNNDANHQRAKGHNMCNRWAIRDRLNREHSELREIERTQIEIAQRLTPDMPTRGTAATGVNLNRSIKP